MLALFPYFLVAFKKFTQFLTKKKNSQTKSKSKRWLKSYLSFTMPNARHTDLNNFSDCENTK